MNRQEIEQFYHELEAPLRKAISAMKGKSQ